MSKRDDRGCTHLLEAEAADIGPREVATRLTEAALERDASYADVLAAYQTIHAAVATGAYPPAEDRPKEPPPEQARAIHIADLAKQTELGVTLPESYRIIWDHSTIEPAPTDAPIFLTLLDVHTGGDWIGRKRLAVTAKRRAKESTWTLLAGIGEGKAGGGTAWSAHCKVNGMTFEELLSGTVDIEGDVMSLQPSARPPRSAAAPWTLSGELTLQVGHEDGRKGEPNKGDEPFAGGTGTVEIFDLATSSSAPLEAADMFDLKAARESTEALEEVLGVLEAQAVGETKAPKRSRGPSGEPTVMDCRAQTRAALATFDPRTPLPWTPTTRQASSRQWWEAAKVNRIRCGVGVHATWNDDVRALVGDVEMEPPGFYDTYAPTELMAAKAGEHWDAMPGRVRDPYLSQALLWARKVASTATPDAIIGAARERATYDLDRLLVNRQEDRSPVWRWLKRQGHVK